jgi:hypothetical protein
MTIAPRISHDEIRRNSETLNELTRRIKAAAAKDPGGHEWRAACAEYHARFDELVYPGGDAMLARVRKNDPVAIEVALRFLTVDPMHFASGYLKESLWRWLKHLPLSDPAKRRLQDAALGYLQRRMSREFWDMARTMHRIGDAEFWRQVAFAAHDAEEPGRSRAVQLLAHGANLHAGAMLRRRLRQEWLRERYGNR